MKYILKHWPLILCLFISLAISFRLFRPGFFSMQDDLQVFRLEQLDLCLKDGQIPCRYIAQGGLGYGYPLYNYYSPLPYYFAEGFHLVGFSYIDSIKIAFIIPNFVRSISMYLLGTSLFGPFGGLISSVLYTLAPYQAINGFVRGALAEHWALSLIPLIFYSLYTSKYNLFTISLSLLFLSHNLTTLYISPILFIFSLVTKKFIKFLKYSLLSFLITSAFLLPVFFEKNLVNVDTMTQGYFYYVNHFATLNELFISRFWGYGASLWGPKDDMSFQIGYAQWLIPLFTLSLYLLYKIKKHRSLIILFFITGLFAIFLTHNKSTFIWKTLPFMPFYQFPWRFLGLVVFSFSLISGALTLIPVFKKILLPISLLIVFLSVLLNFNYFHEDIWYSNLTDSQKLAPSAFINQSGAGLKDYWPKYSTNYPDNFARNTPTLISGQAEILSFSKKSNHASALINVTSDHALVTFPVVYFPNWKLTLNHLPATYTIEPTLGLIQINIPKGNYDIALDFSNTPIRTIGNILSLFGLALFIIKLIREKTI